MKSTIPACLTIGTLRAVTNLLLNRFLPVFALFWVAICIPSASEANDSKKVLVLHSYHQGYLWTDMIHEGFSRTLKGQFPKIEIYTEYMNTKRQTAAEISPHLVEMYRDLYSNVKFDVIAASDNNALDFLLTNRDSLFPGAPVVFCGINDFFKYRLEPAQGYTGVREDLDIASTIGAALKLHPGTKKVALVTDATETGLINLGLVRKVEDKFSAVQFIELHALTAAQLRERLKQLGDDTIVLALAFFRDPEGKTFSARESMEFILSASSRPVYTLWDFYMTSGTVGGKLLSGRLQGENAAKLVARILQGEKAGAIPAIESPTAYMFDYSGLQKFGISESLLPAGSLVTGRPETFYTRYAEYIWLGASLFSLQVIIITLLIRNITRRRQEQTARHNAEQAMRATDKMFSLFMRHSPVYVFIKEVTPAGSRVLQASENFQDMVGIAGSNMIGKTMEELFPPEFAAKITADDRDVIAKVGVLKIDEELNGRFYTTIKFPLVQEDRTLLAGFTIDITDRKLAEEALRQSEVTFRKLFEDSSDAILLIDGTGVFVKCNQAALTLLKMTREQFLLLPPARISPEFQPDGRRSAEAAPEMIALAYSKGLHRFDWTCVNAEGGEFIIEVSLMPIMIKGQTMLHTTWRDITKRKQAEMALQLSEQKFASIFNLMPDMIGITRMSDGCFIEVNDGFERWAGWTREEALGKSSLDLGVWNHEARAQAVAILQQQGHLEEFEFTMRKKSGELRAALMYLLPIIVQNEKCLFFLARDVAEHKRAVEDRISFEKQLLHAQKLESLGVLAGGIAHDFNNILTAIIGNAELALMKLNPESPAQENLVRIEKAAARAADLARQMLAYSGKGKFVVEAIDINRLVEEMGHMLEVSISKKAILRYNLTRPLPAVNVDATQIRQIIMNLVINASEAIGDQSGVIAVTTGCLECNEAYLQEFWLTDPIPAGLYVSLEIADSGCGMDKDTLAKIFDPFFTTKFTGRGLGMAAVLGIVRGHKGAIKVYSEPGKGSSFKVLLPAGEKPAELFNGRVADDSWHGSGVALLVDDEETVRAIGAEMLRELGFEVLTANNGREAVEVFKTRIDISVVILDLTMPHMDGEQCFRELRQLDHDVMVIMSSGFSEHEVTQKFVGKGLTGFVQKPYKLSTLRGVIKGILPR